MEIKLKKTFKTKWLALILVIFLFFIAVRLTEFDIVKGFVKMPEAIAWMFQNFIPSATDFKTLPDILEKLIETILLSIGATAFGGISAFFLSIAGSSVTSGNKILCSLVRAIGCIFRNIPDAIWAMVFLLSFGQNIITGYLAIYFVSFGMLTRAFIETIEETSAESIEALKSVGSSFSHIIFQGLIPSSMSQILSWILYMIETNIRSSTLIGILTGTGIGFLFDIYYKNMNYSLAGLIVITIVIAVLIIEAISNKIRRKIL